MEYSPQGYTAANTPLAPGDIVWAKTEGYPWWPAIVSEPPGSALASHTGKCKSPSILVSFFGDRNIYRWCEPWQVRSFFQAFDQMSLQSSSKSFLSAIDEAVKEIEEFLTLEMTCSCVPDIARQSNYCTDLVASDYQTEEFLASVLDAANVVSMVLNELEIAWLKSWVIAFRRGLVQGDSWVYRPRQWVEDEVDLDCDEKEEEVRKEVSHQQWWKKMMIEKLIADRVSRKRNRKEADEAIDKDVREWKKVKNLVASASSAPTSGDEQEKKKSLRSIEVTSPYIIFYEFRNAAANPLYLQRRRAAMAIMNFFAYYRRLAFAGAQNFMLYQRLWNESRAENEAGWTGEGRVDKERLDVGNGDEEKEKKNKNGNGLQKKPEMSALGLSFQPGFILPHVEQLMKLYIKYGNVVVARTELLEGSSYACILFANRADAEKALYDADAPFRSVATFCLQNFPAEILSVPESIALNQAREKTQLPQIKKNLESMIFTLRDAPSDALKPKKRLYLVAEMEGLLEKVDKELQSIT